MLTLRHLVLEEDGSYRANPAELILLKYYANAIVHLFENAAGIMTTDALPPAASADHLTAVLRKAGVLGDARVRAVDPENPRDTILSHIVRLKLAYDGAAPGAPASLILKTARHDRLDPSWVGGRQEVAFYNQVAPRLPAGLVPRCFDADWSADTNEWHLLLEDLSATHMIATTWPLPPTLGAMRDHRRVAGACARRLVGQSGPRGCRRNMAGRRCARPRSANFRGAPGPLHRSVRRSPPGRASPALRSIDRGGATAPAALSVASQRHHRSRRRACLELHAAARRRKRRREMLRLGQLAHRRRHQRPRLHDRDALVSRSQAAGSRRALLDRYHRELLARGVKAIIAARWRKTTAGRCCCAS